VALTGLIVAAPHGSAAQDARRDTAPLDRIVDETIERHGDGLSVGVWIGGVEGPAIYTYRADAEMPTASAIKTAYLVELFAAYAGRLDEPIGELDALLDDDAHPVFAPFTPRQREEIRQALRGATPRRLGAVMSGRADAPNGVYNAAASLTTALLGGPEELTARLAARDPAFAPITARRYMLADRQANGDNTATPKALAAVLRRLAAREVNGLDAETVEAVREAMVTTNLPGGGRAYVKGGSLVSDPLTRVASGWRETPTGTVVYVVMTAQPEPGDLPRAEAGQRQQETTSTLTRRLLDAIQTARD
jgi:beta-lactamase class A